MSQIILRLNYQTFFDNAENIENLLLPLNKQELLRAVTYLINRSKNEKDAIKTINNWFRNPEIKAELLPKAKPNSSILNVFTSLKLLSYILKKDDISDKINQDEFELRIFKAYLLLNSEQDFIEESGQKNLPPDNSDEKLNATLLTLTYHDFDIQNYVLAEVFLSQFIKSIEYFQFLEEHEKLKYHLQHFLFKYNCTTWQEWIIKLLNLILPIISHNNDTYSEITLDNDEKFEENKIFLNLFSIPIEYTELPDFIDIRSSPLIKIDHNKFIIINKIFLVERIFKSLIFEFSLKINSEIEKELRIKDFRSIYCDFFSEQILLYKTTKRCFPNRFKRISGEDFKSQGYTSEPDYYVRIKNKILLFESKDVILKGEDKLSRDYSILSKGLKEKFLKVEKDGKISKKAILQIIENIKRIFEKHYTKIDVDYKIDHLKIYPILIIHDRQFDAPELNRLLNKWFRKELDPIFNKIEKDQIKDLTIVNIDTLILYQDYFVKRGKYGLEVIIEKYIEFKKPRIARTIKEIENNYLETSVSFSNFCSKFFDKVEFKEAPKFIDDYIKKLNL